jgi:hypothetical protein
MYTPTFASFGVCFGAAARAPLAAKSTAHAKKPIRSR